MKKTILLFAFLLAGTWCANAQIAYYDALKLKSYVSPAGTFEMNNDSTTSAIAAIILKYFPDSVRMNKSALKDMLKNPASKNYNPFLAQYFGSQTASAASLMAGASNVVSNANVGSLASGLSSFLIKRAKQEVMIAIIEHLRDSTKFPEFTVLFPNTLSIMNNFDSWQYSNALNTVEQAFDQDLQQLLGDLPKLAVLKLDSNKLTYSAAVKKRVKAMEKFLSKPEGRALTSALIIGNGFVTGEKIPDIIHTVSGPAYLGNLPGNNDAGNIIQLIDVLSYSVRSNVKGKNYLSASEIKALLSNQVSRDLYFGLIYAEVQQRKITINNIHAEVFIRNRPDSAVRYIDSMITHVDSVEAAVYRLSAAKKKGEKDLFPYLSSIFASGNTFLKSICDLSTIHTSLVVPEKVQDLFDKADSILTIAQTISNQNYSQAIVQINNLFPNNDNSDFRAFLVKYGSFAANLVTAKSADDAENAIEAVALPVGSYSIKQHSEWNIAINGYLGYGWDINSGVSHGIYAPVGFSFSHAVSSSGKAGAVTAFVSLIDVGSMVSYQLNNDSLANKKQDIRLQSIVSPSVQLFYSIPGFPVSLGAGVRRTPKLFYSTTTGFTAVQPRNVFNISILFDIPILNIYNKSYK